MSDNDFAYGRIIADPYPGHAEGCEVQMITNHGEEIVGVCRCVDWCPSLQRSVQRGLELVKENGW